MGASDSTEYKNAYTPASRYWEPAKGIARVLVLKVVGLGEEMSKRGTAGSVCVFVCARYNLGLSSLDRGKSSILSK